MARDHFVYWKSDRGTDHEKPTKDQIVQVVRQFFGPVLKEIVWTRGEFLMITLVGMYSEPLRDLHAVHCWHDPADDSRERWIEIVVDDGSLDVLTRHQDTFTNACAMELAKIFARGWGGKLEAG